MLFMNPLQLPMPHCTCSEYFLSPQREGETAFTEEGVTSYVTVSILHHISTAQP